MKITIVFKNGYSFSMTCESFTLNKTFEEITGYTIKGINFVCCYGCNSCETCKVESRQ